MKINEATEAIIAELWSRIEPQVREGRSLEEGAHALATELYMQFADSVVLARVFLTVRFDVLPVDLRLFVENLAHAAGKADSLKGPLPVLSLVGTHGQEAAWNARQNSRGHQGIPVFSASFVTAIPMIARLFRELGVPLHWIDSHDARRIATLVGHSGGLFFVPDAKTAVDEHGRKIITDEDFVTDYGVQTVFGTGTVYARGQILVIVIFCKDEVKRATAQQFPPLGDLFKRATASLVDAGRVFTPI